MARKKKPEPPRARVTRYTKRMKLIEDLAAKRGIRFYPEERMTAVLWIKLERAKLLALAEVVKESKEPIPDAITRELADLVLSVVKKSPGDP